MGGDKKLSEQMAEAADMLIGVLGRLTFMVNAGHLDEIVGSKSISNTQRIRKEVVTDLVEEMADMSLDAIKDGEPVDVDSMIKRAGDVISGMGLVEFIATVIFAASTQLRGMAETFAEELDEVEIHMIAGSKDEIKKALHDFVDQVLSEQDEVKGDRSQETVDMIDSVLDAMEERDEE